jgi:hypothetical protein
MACSSALPLHVCSAFPGGHYSSDKPCLARRGKITDVLLDTCGYPTLAWYNIRAIGFDIGRTRPRTWLRRGGRSGNKEQGSAKRQNWRPCHFPFPKFCNQATRTSDNHSSCRRIETMWSAPGFLDTGWVKVGTILWNKGFGSPLKSRKMAAPAALQFGGEDA